MLSGLPRSFSKAPNTPRKHGEPAMDSMLSPCSSRVRLLPSGAAKAWHPTQSVSPLFQRARPSKNAGDDSPLRQHGMRAMLAIVQRPFLVDADRLIDGGRHVARSPAGARWKCRVLVGRADDLAAAHAATGEDE